MHSFIYALILELYQLPNINLRFIDDKTPNQATVAEINKLKTNNISEILWILQTSMYYFK